MIDSMKMTESMIELMWIGGVSDGVDYWPGSMSELRDSDGSDLPDCRLTLKIILTLNNDNFK